MLSRVFASIVWAWLLGACQAQGDPAVAQREAALREVAQVPSAGCRGFLPDLGGVWHVQVGGELRQMNVHLPKHYNLRRSKPAPLMLSFHGYRNFPLFQQVFSGLDETADREGFVLVYPKGSGDPLGFNGSGCCGQAWEDGTDDVAFARAMLDKLERELCIDRRRVFVSGFSNGGFMAHRLACELSDRVAAIASVAGLIQPSSCTPARPMPVLQFHGTADETVPFAGSETPGRFASVPDTFSFWAEADGCRGEAEVSYEQGDARCERYTDCDAGAEVELCVIDEGGHTWPGGLDNFLVEAVAGKVSDDIEANDRIWSFFERHPLPESIPLD